MNNRIRRKEEEYEELQVDRQIAGTKAEIAERKAKERLMKKEGGRDIMKIMGGVFKSVRVNKEALHDMYGANPDLRDMSNPRRMRRFK